MKKIIIFCFTTLFFLVISFASVNAKECEIDECENNLAVNGGSPVGYYDDFDNFVSWCN